MKLRRNNIESRWLTTGYIRLIFQPNLYKQIAFFTAHITAEVCDCQSTFFCLSCFMMSFVVPFSVGDLGGFGDLAEDE
jgi:hypothetical protein